MEKFPNKEAWIRQVLDLVTITRSGKCPVCGSLCQVHSDETAVFFYCPGCRSCRIVAILCNDCVTAQAFVDLVNSS